MKTLLAFGHFHGFRGGHADGGLILLVALFVLVLVVLSICGHNKG